jgi:hypothetical protein
LKSFKNNSLKNTSPSSKTSAHRPTQPTTTNNAQTQQPPQRQTSVFDRLSRESTISFSRKINQPLTNQQKHHLKARHEEQLIVEEEHELNVESSKETVGVRIARLEGTHLNHSKRAPSVVAKKNIPLKAALDRSNQSKNTSKPRPKSLYEEMQASQQAQPDNGSISSSISLPPPPQPSRLSPNRDNAAIPMSKQSTTPIRKSIPPQERKIQEEKRKQVLTKFFYDLLEHSKSREYPLQDRLDKFFSNLVKQSKKRAAAARSVTASKLQFSPRKRTMSQVGARYAEENIKKARFEVEKSKKERTGQSSSTAKSGSKMTYRRE